MRKKIIIVAGDPNSINSEIIFKCWKKINHNIKKRIYLIGNYKLILSQFKKINAGISLIKVKNINSELLSNKLKIIDIPLNFKNPFNVSNKSASKFVLESLDKAHKLALDNNILGIINCPINKTLLNKEKFGVTEYLAAKCAVKKNSEAMLIKSSNFSVCPITTHIPIKDIAKKISSGLIINKVKTINLWFKKKLKKKPKICILGLNPHNGEMIKSSEERKIIVPSIKKLKKLNINIKGPYVADTFFIKEYKKFDVIVGMYHDQVLTPIKTLFKYNAINVTLGLKYLRVSPDHGVAKELIGKKKADATSLLDSITFINKFGK